MRAILVSVNYADLLAVTLPYNRHHFDEVLVVTTPTDTNTLEVAQQNRAGVYFTTSFYDDEAHFNKWKALEEGLDNLGRREWLCIMDADVLWPKQLPPIDWQKGCLYTPLCYIDTNPRLPLPPESEWARYPLRPNQKEWAGYSQIFHADDPVLGPPPWHQIDWRHCGGADSFFQLKWPPNKKIRPPFKIMHLGAHGRNWCGRATRYLDGTVPDGAEDRAKAMSQIYKLRRQTRSFDTERIK